MFLARRMDPAGSAPRGTARRHRISAAILVLPFDRVVRMLLVGSSIVPKITGPEAVRFDLSM